MSNGVSRWARVAAVAALAAIPVAGVAVLPAGDAHAQEQPGYNVTKQITDGRGESRPATVAVDKTGNLFDRAQVAITLSGFLPTWNAGSVADTGSEMENPVVVMQCRGADPRPETCLNRQRSVFYAGYDGAIAEDPGHYRERAKTITRNGSWSGFPGDGEFAKKANALATEQLPFVHADGTEFLWDPGLTVREDGSPLINEPTRKSYAPPDTALTGTGVIATRSIPIPESGTNRFLFEVRQRVSQPSLGCSDTVACSIVVVPVMQPKCAADAPDGVAGNSGSTIDCEGGHATGVNPPGQPGTGPLANRFLSARAWFAESNWKNRFVVPISFDPDPETCAIRDPRPQLPLFGSELIDVAQQQWGLAYCEGARAANYLPVYTQRSEYEARRQFTSKIGEAYLQDAVLTAAPVTDSPRPVVHAPSGLTGFAVAFTVDDANGEQVRDLTLSPRLLAKLLTQSYSAELGPRLPDEERAGKRQYTGAQPVNSDTDARQYYVEHPTVSANPQGLFMDPELVALNPDLVLKASAGDTLVAAHLRNVKNPVVFQVESDVVVELTRYLSADPATRAWLDGAPDEHGMRVNPVWQGMQPFQLYGLLDQWARPAAPKRRPGWTESQPEINRWFVPGAGGACDDVYKTPALTRLANITNSAEQAATTLLDRRGSATPECSQPTAVPEEPGPPKFEGDVPGVNFIVSEAKPQPKEFGQRALLAITTLAHAELYELPTARLRNAAGVAVPPVRGTMVAALGAPVQDPGTGTVHIDHGRLTGNAYPGTMVVYTAAPTAGLDRDTAARYADFIEFMATEGQATGDGPTSLPPGYDPLPESMRQQARDAAAAVREQRGEVPGPIPAGEVPASAATDDPLPATAADNPGNGTVPAATPQAAGPNATAPGGGPRPAAAVTQGAKSWWAQWTLLLLLAAGGAVALAAGTVNVATSPDHPARRVLRKLVRR